MTDVPLNPVTVVTNGELVGATNPLPVYLVGGSDFPVSEPLYVTGVETVGNYTGASIIASGYIITPLAGDNGALWFTSDGLTGPILQGYEDGFCAFTKASGAGVDFNFTASNVWGWGKGDDDDPIAAQTQMVQGRSGQNNAAGVDWTFKLSSSTGNAVGGGWVMQGTPAGSTGTTTNTFVDLLRVTAKGSLVIGSAAIATDATDGFLYLPTCAGTPTGTPTTRTGRSPVVYDTSAHILWVYDGGWKQPKAGATAVTWV